MRFKNVLSPIKIGNLTVKNRFVVPAMGSGLPNQDGTISRRSIDYYAARAKGGFGLIISEFTCVDPEGMAFPGQALIWDDSFIPSHKNLTDAVHENGGLIFCQLHHAGRETTSTFTQKQPVSASPIPSPTYKEIPRELSTEEVYQLIEKFAQAAYRAKQAGYDGVELHGAHQYMIAQFMSPYSNKRNDEFGGNFENRMRFATEIIKAIKEKCGADFPTGIRISAIEPVASGKRLKESRAEAKALEEAGADFINVSYGGYGVNQKTLAPQAIEPGYNADNAAYIKKILNVPVIVAGRINDPYIAEEIIASGSADLVALGRSSLADPEFPKKTAEGRIEEIIPCVACLQRCAGKPARNETEGGVSCTYNPFTGKEGLWKIEPAEKPKKIAVVGAGPAGLETAWIAAKRGHSVTVFEKNHKPGGQMIAGAIPPHKQELSMAVRSYWVLGKKYGVDFRFGVEATADMVKDFDEVVLATGGVPARPLIAGLQDGNVVDATEVLEGKAFVGQNVLIVGGGLVGAETAEFLGENGRQVTIMEMLSEIASDLHIDVKIMLMERLNRYGVKILTNAKIVSFAGNKVKYEKDGKVSVLDGFDNIILALGTKAFNPLEKDLANTGVPVHVIGDAKEPGNITDAVYEAAKLAITI